MHKQYIKNLIYFFFLVLPNILLATTTWNVSNGGKTATLSNPYENNSNVSQALSISGATGLQVTISGETESGYDYVYITDSSGTQRRFDGSINSTFVVAGESIGLLFTSDNSQTKSGVVVTIVSTTLPPTSTPTPTWNYWKINAAKNSAILTPNPYLDNKDTFTQRLKILGATSLNVTITGSIENQSSCTYDYATILDASGNYTHPGTKNNRFCGAINQTFTVSGDHIDVFFHADGGATDTGVTITIVSPNTSPTAHAGPSQSIVKGSTVTFDGHLSNDPDGSINSYVWSYNGTTLATGVHGTYNTGAPNNTPAGVYNVLLTVTDNNGAQNTNTATVNITITNTAPIATAQSVTTDEDTPITITLTGSDPDGDTITSYSIASSPANGTLSSITGNTVDYFPNPNYNGTDSFTFTVNDGTDNSAPATVSININPIDDANLSVSEFAAPTPNPVAINNDVTFSIRMKNFGPNTALGDITLATVYDQNVTLTSLTKPTEFSCSPISGTLPAFTPIICTKTNQMNSGAIKDFTFTVQPSTAGTMVQTTDATSTTPDPDTTNNMVQSSVVVTSPPVANDGNETTITNHIFTIDINNHASDSDGSLGSMTIVSTPSVDYNLTIIGTSIIFNPTLNFEGNTSFDYTVTDNDGLVSNAATIFVSVLPNNNPIAYDRNYTTLDTVPLIGNLITGTGQSSVTNTPDNDPDGDSLSILSFTQPDPALGTVGMTIGGDGNFTFNPVAGAGGVDANFTYVIEDGFGGSAEANVTIHLIAAQADLSTSKTAPSNVLAGSPISYTVTIESAAGSQYTDAANVRMIDTLPSGFVFNGFTSPTGWVCAFVGGTITCDISSYAQGSTDTLQINGFAPTAPGVIVNHATIISSTLDTNTSNNDSNVSTTVDAVNVDMVITKTAAPDPVITTSLLTYTLNIRNNGSNDATAVVVEDRLDSSLLFVSVDGGGDWSCGQGSVILCDYTANGGVFTPGATPSDIIIKVTTPIQAGDINNTANVKSAVDDIDTSNNEANATVTVNEGTTTGADYNLTKYLQYNIFGDIKLIGNANINWDGTNYTGNDNPPLYNDSANMLFIDSDTVGNTFNSSSSNFDNNYTVIWAGLYWEGHICKITSPSYPGTYNNTTKGCKYNHMPNSRNTYSKAKSKIGKIKFKIPGSGYQNIQANTVNRIEQNRNINFNNGSLAYSRKDLTYSAFKDVTNLVNTSGTFSVANIILTEGQTNYGGNYGGWAMLVIYEDDNKSLHYKNISVFNGFQSINSDDNPVQIDGFLTPLSGTVTASIAFFAGDGDPSDGGVGRMREKKTNAYSAIGSATGTAKSPKDNLLNSTIGEYGQPINTNILTTYGVDADRIDVSSFMTNNQTDTEFRFDITTPSGGVDWYTLSMFTFATDLTTPIIDKNGHFLKTAVIIDANGSSTTAGPHAFIYPGNELKYTLRFQNTGDEVAEKVEILDDFDFDTLSPALDLNNFDITKTHLYDNNGDEVLPKPCHYSPTERRISCYIPTVAVLEEYRMVFSVTVRSSLTTTILDENATNTAYAKYKNPNGDSYVIDVTVNGEDFGGSSETLNAGTFALKDPGSYTFIHLDAINNNYTYSQDKNITTKIVNQPFKVKLVHINRSGENRDYVAWFGKPMPVILTLESDPATLLVSDPSSIQFTASDSFKIADNILIPKAHRADRLQMGYLDWGTILTWVPPNSPCITNPASSTRLRGLPQCFNQLLYAQDVFSAASFPEVTNICYGQGGTLPAGSDFACSTSSYPGGVASGNISPAKYNHSYGCYHCITDAYPEGFISKSTDDFSARPKNFLLGSTHNSFPDLLRAGNEYNLSIIAQDGTTPPTASPTTAYTQPNNSIESNATKYLNDGTASALLHGTASLTYNDYNITDGISVSTSTASNEVVGISYDDVGRVSIQLADKNWAAADNDDTPKNCATPDVGTIEAHLYICGDINVTYIPDHFTVNNITLGDHRAGSFTYLSNDLNMSAHVGVTVQAKNSADNITQNFSANLYENPIGINMNLTANPHPTNNNKIENNITTAALGFGGIDANGTHTIATTETNVSQQLMFNFERTNNAPVNPFDYNVTDINISVQSEYTGTAPDSPVTIRGSAVGTGANQSHFFYGRTKASKELYNNVDSSSKNTPILLQVYCNSWPAVCPQLANITYLNTSDNDWKINQDHNASKDDGNITLTSPPAKLSGGSGNAPTVTTTVDIITLGKNDAITVNRGGTDDLPMTLGINLNTVGLNTSSWLIYNPSNPTSDPIPFYRVKFIGTSGWTGFGNTGNVVDANASKKIHNRLGW